MIWHNSTVNEVLGELNTDKEKGLYHEAAKTRLNEYGENRINDYKTRKFLSCLLDEMKRFYNIALIITALVFIVVTLSLDSAGLFDSLFIVLIALLNIVLSAYRKNKASIKLNSLKGSVSGTAQVLRSGEIVSVPAKDLVPGDIMILKAGDYIMADGRLIDSYVLKCNEFALTGESVPSDKLHDILYEDITPIEDRHNMVYSGTSVVNGRGLAVVTGTGSATEIGKIKKIAKQTEKSDTAFSLYIRKFSGIVSLITTVFSVIIFLLGTIINIFNPTVSFAVMVLQYILIALALCFSASSEILPSILRLNILNTVVRLKDKNAVITNVKCLDDFKDIDIICSDKTGVLTKGELTAVKAYTANRVIDLTGDTADENLSSLTRLALICSNFKPLEHAERHANTTEKAIEELSIKLLGVSKADIDGMYPKLAELPFDSERMLMTTVSAISGAPYAIVKGAPEIIAERCNNINKEEYEKVLSDFTGDGLKVIAVAYKTLDDIPANPNEDELEHELSFVGFIAFDDEIDREAVSLIAEAKKHGIKTVMITGDHLGTALAVGLKLGIASSEADAVTGEELAGLNDDELKEKIESYTVFARISPEDKLRIVSAYKAIGKKVVVTGDSINDTPALLESTIGCALGLTASDMVKDSADVVLSDNRFISLINAYKETNTMYHKIQKCTGYFISFILAEVLILLFGIIAFGTAPLSAGVLLISNALFVMMIFAITYSKQQILTDTKGDFKFIGKDFLIKNTVPAFITAVITLVGFGLCIHSAAFALAFLILIVSLITEALWISINRSVFTESPKTYSLELIGFGFCLLLSLLVTVTTVGGLVPFWNIKLIGWLMIAVAFVSIIIKSEAVKLIYKNKF